MSQNAFDKLVKLTARLRAKNGCPWDRAQTHSSIKKFLIEEAYEVCDVIDSKNPEKLKDELGDLLFQVLFHSQIARERGAFDINGVLRASYRKMLRRHPHVFGKHKARGEEDAYKRWQKVKDAEKENKDDKSLLRGVPKHLPALLKAYKVTKRAGWDGYKVKTGKRKQNKQKITGEIGDKLFKIAAFASAMHIDPEEALNKSVKKFALRFKNSI